jgi:signal transduction histidine kinase
MQDQENLKLYFLIAPALYLVNTLIATSFAIKYKKDPIYRKSAAIWFCYLLLGVSQGALSAAAYETKAIAWSMASFFACTAMSVFVSDIFRLKVHYKRDTLLFFTAIIVNLALFKLQVPFFWATLPATFFAAFPVLKLLPQLRYFKQHNFTKIGTLICYLLIAMHGVDYAYAGDKPELLFPGYLLALMLAMGASGFTFAALIERAIIEIEIKDLLQSTARLTALGAMAAEISHEIKNPLTVLTLNNSQMKMKMQESNSNNFDASYFITKTEIAERMLKRLVDIMNTLRSHYNSGIFDDFKKIKIKDIFEEVKLVCSFRAQKAGIKVHFQDFEDDMFVECRTVQIIQVIQNLVQNAMDSLEGVPSPKISIKARKLNEDTVELAVSDNGVGVPEEIRDLIFDPFFTTKPKDKGSGLGLSISKRFIEDHGGKLYLEKSIETKFVIILPILQNNRFAKKSKTV